MTTEISEVENKILDTSSLVTATVLSTNIGDVEKTIPDLAKYISPYEFNKLTAEDFVIRLKRANLMSKTDFENKLISFNTKITSNEKKYFEVQQKKN